jgi:hypothetical protein
MALALAFGGPALAQSAPSVDDLVARNTAARGGAEKIKAIRSLRITGQATAPNGMSLPLTLYVKRPALTRMEMALESNRIVQAFDGSEAWTINPLASGEPTRVSAEESKSIHDDAESMLDGFLMDYRAKGIGIEAMGQEDVGGSPAYKLKITTRQGVTIFLGTC